MLRKALAEPAEPVPRLAIGGWLNAGKSTLVNASLAQRTTPATTPSRSTATRPHRSTRTSPRSATRTGRRCSSRDGYVYDPAGNRLAGQ